MKKNILKISLLALLTVSCNQNKKPAYTQPAQSIEVITTDTLMADTLQFETLKIYANDSLFKGRSYPCYTLSLNVGYCKAPDNVADAVNKKINEAITQHNNPEIAQSLKDYADSLKEATRQDLLEDFDPDNEELSENLQYHYYIGGEFSPMPLSGYLSYTISSDVYTGGPHGIREISYLNFNKTDGSFMTKEKVFNASKEKELLNIILKKIMESRDCATLEELHNKTSITLIGDLYVAENFLLEKTGVTFVYNTYEIASYSDGTILAFVPYEELNDILKIKVE